jgi:hypothetical protein
MVGDDETCASRTGPTPVGRGPVKRVISGGQTGVDRAALDAALALGLPCGGWCPRDRHAEDGRIDERYPLVETDSPDPAVRTRRNAAGADGTLILAPPGELTGGTALTAREAETLGRPCLVVDPASTDAPAMIRQWLGTHAIASLNVAGPRESQSPGIYDRVLTLLMRVLADDG